MPQGSAEAYRAHAKWGRFANIEEIEVVVPSVPGDLNGDGAVDVEDVNAIINLILENITADQLNGNPDVTGDGVTDIADINEIINMILAQ